MGKFKRYLIFATILISIVSFIGNYLQAYKISRQKAEIERKNNNYKVVKDSLKLIKGENGLYAARIEAQDLTIGELKTYYGSLARDIEDMKIDLRKVAGITVFNTETTNNIHTLFRDSTVNDTVPIQYIDHHSKWFDLQVIKQDKDALIKQTSRDSLIQVIHWDYTGKLWLTRFLTSKEYHQDIRSANPDSRIKYAEWININRKRNLRRELRQY
jgi:hypothetical protein